MVTLDRARQSEILALSREGERYSDEGDFRPALSCYINALKLIPRPVTDWEAATWLYAAIGDTYWFMDDLRRAYRAFQRALISPGGIGNPFIHLRIGELEYEFGNRPRAVDELLRAYMGGGREIFQREDPKYFSLIEDVI
jgi:tetratricopeptide (TPR) repeat protein